MVIEFSFWQMVYIIYLLDNIEWMPSQREKIQNIHNKCIPDSQDRELLKQNYHFRQAYKHLY